MDKELERRGHRFARYADECNVYVRSKRTGERVMQTLVALFAELRLQVNVSARLVQWLRRRLRAIHLKHRKRGSTVFRELRRRGVSALVAAMAARFTGNWWRVAGHAALHLPLPTSYFDQLGVPRLVAR
jgi:hypothetical protein